MCEFCESGPATKHCPDDVCGFMCDNCDTYRHESGGGKTIEYADHERAKVTAGFRASVGARARLRG